MDPYFLYFHVYHYLFCYSKILLLFQVVRFYKSYNVTVRDIHILNSPLCHLKFDNSRGVKVWNITITSPQDSPNTDGIHLQNTRDVEIKHSNIGCGKA